MSGDERSPTIVGCGFVHCGLRKSEPHSQVAIERAERALVERTIATTRGDVRKANRLATVSLPGDARKPVDLTTAPMQGSGSAKVVDRSSEFPVPRNDTCSARRLGRKREILDQYSMVGTEKVGHGKVRGERGVS
jgi:hypothetical protein